MSENPLQKKYTAALAASDMHRAFAGHRGFLSYARTAWRSANFYAHWTRWISALRRFRLIALILRLATLIFAALETGALVLLTTVLLLLCLPVLIFLTLVILITAVWEAPRKNREIHAKTAQKRVYVLFLEEESGDFFKANAYDLASRENSAVVIVSPYPFATRGLRKDGDFYVTARLEAENVFLVRRYYFFSLRKKVLMNGQCAFLY